MRPTLARPRRATLPLVAGSALLLLWELVAHESGVGWVQAVGALVAGALVVGFLAPALAVARLRCRVVACPADATAGTALTVHVEVSAPCELHPVDPSGPASVSGRARRVRVEIAPPHRGIVDRMKVTVASAAPFGMLWWTRTVELALPHPLAVAPRTGRPDPAACVEAGVHDASAASPGRGTEPRGVRAYERGDRRHLVHWPATAHIGALMVRETERPARRSVIVRGILPDDPRAAEAHAARVMGTVAELLATGADVELVTREADGEVTASVATLAAAGRRLAYALPRGDAAHHGAPARDG